MKAKQDDTDSVISGQSETLMRTLTEHKSISEHLSHSYQVEDSKSPSIEIISPHQSKIGVGAGKIGGGADEIGAGGESTATNDTGSTGSKRKRVRHRKKKRTVDNDENQMNVTNVETAADGILMKNPFSSGSVSKILTKSNTHVRLVRLFGSIFIFFI